MYWSFSLHVFAARRTSQMRTVRHCHAAAKAAVCQCHSEDCLGKEPEAETKTESTEKNTPDAREENNKETEDHQFRLFGDKDPELEDAFKKLSANLDEKSPQEPIERVTEQLDETREIEKER